MAGARLNAGERDRILRADLRCKTATVLFEPYEGVRKMVAANRPPHGVSRQRIDREIDGHDANRLELLCQDLDRIVIEKGFDAVGPVLAFLEARYSSADIAADGVLDDLAGIADASGDLLSDGIEKAKDGIQSSELPALEQKAHRLRERVDRFVKEAHVAAAKGRKLRAIKSA